MRSLISTMIAATAFLGFAGTASAQRIDGSHQYFTGPGSVNPAAQGLGTGATFTPGTPGAVWGGGGWGGQWGGWNNGWGWGGGWWSNETSSGRTKSFRLPNGNKVRAQFCPRGADGDPIGWVMFGVACTKQNADRFTDLLYGSNG